MFQFCMSLPAQKTIAFQPIRTRVLSYLFYKLSQTIAVDQSTRQDSFSYCKKTHQCTFAVCHLLNKDIMKQKYIVYSIQLIIQGNQSFMIRLNFKLFKPTRKTIDRKALVKFRSNNHKPNSPGQKIIPSLRFQ